MRHARLLEIDAAAAVTSHAMMCAKPPTRVRRICWNQKHVATRVLFLPDRRAPNLPDRVKRPSIRCIYQRLGRRCHSIIPLSNFAQASPNFCRRRHSFKKCKIGPLFSTYSHLSCPYYQTEQHVDSIRNYKFGCIDDGDRSWKSHLKMGEKWLNHQYFSRTLPDCDEILHAHAL